MNYNEQIIEIKKIIQNKEYSVAEEKLLSLISTATVKNIEDENNTHYSFNNYIETLLFWNIYRPEKKNIDPDINYAQVYYYLGFINIEQKNYGKALEYLQKGLQWNPLDVTLIFEVAAIYRMTGNIERFKAEIEKAHPFIYDSSYMAKYYRELGWYYVEKRVFDLANALYTQSIGFFDTEIARNELGFIAKQENREPRFSTKEEIKKLFTDYNIWSGFNRNTINLIYEEFKRLQAVKPQPAIVRYLSQRLYDITLDKNFMTYYELKDNEHGVKIRVPETWKYLEKSSYEKANIAPNTTFFLMTPVTLTVNIVCDGKCSNKQLDEAFKVNIENMKKNGTEVEKQYSTEGNLRNRQAFIKVKQNDKVIRLFQVYKVVNGYLFCISWQVTNEDVNLDQLLTNVLNSFAMGVVNSFEPINSNETKAEDIAEQVTNVLNNAKEVDFKIQNINEEYTKNKISEKLIKMLHIFSDTVISEDKQFEFKNYKDEELYKILEVKCNKYNLIINEDVKQKVMEVFKYFSSVENFGNGRFVDKFLQEILVEHSQNKKLKDNLNILMVDDIPSIKDMVEKTFNNKDNLVIPSDIDKETRRKIAIHELGHAIIYYIYNGETDLKVITVIPEGSGALGYVLHTNPKTKVIWRKRDYLDTIEVSLAGRAAEEVILGTENVSSGCWEDLEKATQTLTNMLNDCGMSETLGLISARSIKPSLDMTQKLDDEKKKILDDCYNNVKKVLQTNKKMFDKVLNELMKKGTLTGEAFVDLIKEK